MAATAHAFVVSLMNTMGQIQTHPSLSTCFDHHQFNFLSQNVDFFLDFVENYSHIDNEEIEDLVRRIGASAHAAEDMIEVEAADRLRSRILLSEPPTLKSLTFLGEKVDRYLDSKTIEIEDQEAHRMRSGSTSKSLTFLIVLQRLIEDMNSIKEKVIKLKEETGLFTDSMPPPSSLSSSPTATTATKKTKMVGFEGHVAQLLDNLISSNSQSSARQVLPIVGMGGIGKTTLARNIYEHSVVLHHFDVRAWVTVSQDYDATDILSQALSCLGRFKSMNDTSGDDDNDDEVCEKLRKILYDRRYLIVLDDVWSVKAWEKIQFCFPDNNNGSRIVVTTRQQKVVHYFASLALAPNLLDDKNAWELFNNETFGDEGCPPELQVVGRKIVKKCKGLPLAISVIGGLLGKSSRTLEYWDRIAQDRSLILGDLGDEGNQVLSILDLSYKNLPVWLKSCFLYLGLFPEDHRINASELIKLLVAEGYIKANGKQSLEEVAESYLRELVDRNLLLVGDLSLNKALKTCYLHDVVRELCISIAQKEDFYYVQRSIDGYIRYIVDERTTSLFGPRRSSPEATSLISRPTTVRGRRKAPLKSRLMRVCQDSRFFDIFRQFNLRYLFYSDSCSLPIPRSFSLCWSLQTLYLSGRCALPSEFWTMPHLRHIIIAGYMIIPDPPKDNSAIVLNNLLTLETVEKLNFTEEFCRRIPNIKHFGVQCNFYVRDGASYCFSVGCLKKLEVLRFASDVMEEYVGNTLQNSKLPTSLRELDLSGCSLAWSEMAMFASLPHLQILVLADNAAVGAEWSCVEEKFRCLKHLKITSCTYLTNWIAESFNFPVLETLSLSYLDILKKIPSGIGEIATLESIDLRYCSASASISAIKILEEQEFLGNESLRLRIEIEQSEGVRDGWKEKYPKLRVVSTYDSDVVYKYEFA